MAELIVKDNALSIAQVDVAGSVYDIVDTTARANINILNAQVEQNTTNIETNASDIADLKEIVKGGVHYIGKSKTEIADGSTTLTIIIDDGTEEGAQVTAKAGDLVIYASKEFVCDGTKWNEFGDITGLGELAFADSATGSYTPAGTVTNDAIADKTYELTGSFSGTEKTISPSLTLNDVTGVTGTFTGTELTATAGFSGTETTLTAGFSGTETTLTAGFSGTGVTPTAGFTGTEGNLSVVGTPVGDVSKPDATVTPSSAATGSTEVVNGVLKINFGNALTAVAVDVSKPTFTGTELSSSGKFTPAGNVAVDSFTPAGNVTVQAFTPAGNVTVQTFTPAGNVTVNPFTPEGTVAVDTFKPTGSIADITYKPEGTIAGTTKVEGHNHTATFVGTTDTVTVTADK